MYTVVVPPTGICNDFLLVNCYSRVDVLVMHIWLLSYTCNTSLPQPNKFISIVNKEHRELTLFSCFDNRIDCQEARLSVDGIVFSGNNFLEFRM